jgi:hypothetical protein
VLSEKFSATDSRDKVFAILPLTRNPDLAVIDYNCTETEVLANTAKCILLTDTNSLALFCQAQRFARKSGLSSWIPSWSSATIDSVNPLSDYIEHYGWHGTTEYRSHKRISSDQLSRVWLTPFYARAMLISGQAKAVFRSQGNRSCQDSVAR